MLKWGCLSPSFPYPPAGHEEVDEPVEPDSTTADVHSVNQVRESQPIEKQLDEMKEQLLHKYKPVFKEDLGPDDTIKGVVRFEVQDNEVKPLHFTTPPPYQHILGGQQTVNWLGA